MAKDKIEASETINSDHNMETTSEIPGRDKAVALQYFADQGKGRVTASGQGELAHLIIELARANNVPILKDSSLAEILSALSTESLLSDESSGIVAEIICFLYELDSNLSSEK